MRYSTFNIIRFSGIILALGVLLAGCASKPQVTPSSDYRTVARDLRRDTDLAKQKNAQGVALIKAGKYAEAAEALKDALSADVTFGPAHNNLGVAYYRLSDSYKAAWEFQYAAKLMPDQPEPHNNLGMVLESANKLDDAVKAYDEALQMRPDNPQFVGNEARARFQRGDRDERERNLLQKLATIDTRPQWSDWAKEKLILMGTAAATRP